MDMSHEIINKLLVFYKEKTALDFYFKVAKEIIDPKDIKAAIEFDHTYANVNNITDISQHTIGKIVYFFTHYKDLENKVVKIGKILDYVDALPIYNRDAELFVGSLERLEDWLAGVRWARDYDRMLKLSNETKRQAGEQQQRNRQLMRTLKEGQCPERAR